MKKAVNYFVIFVMLFVAYLLAYRWLSENAPKIKSWLEAEELDKYFRDNLMRVVEAQVKSMLKIKWSEFRKEFVL